MFSNPGFMIRVAPLFASLALMFSCCYLYDTPLATPTPAPTATPACTMHFTHPANGAALPLGSLTTFSWTSVAKASTYFFAETGPGDNGGQVIFPTTNTSWPVYPNALGTYSALVQAR